MIYSAEDTNRLEEILVKLETVYSPLMNSEEYHSENIEEVISSIFSYFETLEDEDETFALINENVVPIMSELSYLVHRASYYGRQVVVFDNFPNAIQVSQFIFKLTKASFADKMELPEYKGFLAILAYIDEERVEHKFGLPYRLLKLLFIMMLYKAVVGVSILSKFVLHQVALSANIDA